MRVLCVAEKPSIAKAITQILSGGRFTSRNSANKYIKNYDFDYPQTNAQFTVTSVTGHLMDHEFESAYSSWQSCDPFALFDANIVATVKKGSEATARNLSSEARRAQMLMIWTDCDREGENIGAEIMGVCRKSKRDIQVRRARFSAIIAQQIHNAAQNPVPLDMAQSSAVEARILLDLRIGAAFTRLQTLTLQARFNQLKDVISYGPCQFPTLGFVVSRYNQVKSFVPEDFWYIYLALSRDDANDSKETPFNWRRGHLFDFDVSAAIYEHVLEDPLARVTKVTNKDTKKWKPLPLTTVDLQKASSRLLKISPKKALDIAEGLYQKGFLSYPRTETDQYDPQFDFMTLIGKQTADGSWGQFAESLQNGGFNPPRRGKNNDKAHPPIHPTAHAGNLEGDDKRVYDYITRRFLASCSKDALGWETTIDVVCGGEDFYATGLIVKERNYLDVFPYDKWSDKELPNFRQGETFMPSVCELRDGQTSRPNLLTEADLVTLMDKNGIGTDATIAQHIQTIVERKYVIERMQGATKYLVPSTLGIGLVEGYNEIGFDRSLSRPEMRRETERQMVQICQGLKTKNDMLVENIELYKEMFLKIKRDMGRIIESVGTRLQGRNVDYEADFLDDFGPGGGGGGGRGGRGGRGGGRGARGAAAARGAAPASRRGRGGRGGYAAPLRPPPPPSPSPPPPPRRPPPDDDDDEDLFAYFDDDPPAPPPPARSRAKPASAPAPPRPPPPAVRPPASSASQSIPSCECGQRAASRTVSKESIHKGRQFYTCPNTPPCGFFQWADGMAVVHIPSTSRAAASSSSAASGSQNAAADSSDKQCRCPHPAVQRQVQKEGPTKGKMFWTCPNPQAEQCGYFEWADGTSGASSGGSGSNECFKCGKIGHWASACPNPDGGSMSRSGTRSFGGGGGVDKSNQECFSCGRTGHFSSECPNGPSRGRGGGGGSGGGGGNNCFKCGTPGHFSNACPVSAPRGMKRSATSAPRAAKRGRRGGGSGRGRGKKKASSFEDW